MTNNEKQYRYNGIITVFSFDDETDCYNVVFDGKIRKVPREEFDRDYEEIRNDR